MADYIKREDMLRTAYRNYYPSIDHYCVSVKCATEKELRELPAADVVEVVRCKDCMYRVTDTATNARWCIWNSRISDDDYFCADGKRKEAKT